MGTQSNRLSSDFSQALTDIGETVSLTHRVSQALNTTSGAYTEIDEVQNITAIPSLASNLSSQAYKQDKELNPSKYTQSDRSFRFRAVDLSVSSVDIGDKITYNSTTYKIIEIAHEIMGIYKVIGRKA